MTTAPPTGPSRPETEPGGRRPRRRWPLVVVLITVVTVVAIVLVGAEFGARIEAKIDATLGGQSAAAGNSEPGSTDSTRGAAAIGTYVYSIPGDALYVSPNGNDSGPGTRARPFLSVQSALDASHAGQTIVLRGGVYNQRVTVLRDKPVTIEPFPHEAVWFDGSTVVSNWRKSGTSWVSTGWTAEFDDSPTFTRGAAPSSRPSFAFINPEYPLAAHPDQVWINGVALTQVATEADVTAGTFAVDYATSRLVVGSNPNGHVVRASNKSKAFSLQAAGTIVRGIGIRRYATSLPQLGALTVEAPHITVEDVAIIDNATTGLFVGAAEGTVRNVTLEDNGMMGMYANYADKLTVTHVVSDHNNLQRFNQAPVAGGFKITSSRQISVRDSSFNDNLGPGLWFDESDYDVTVVADSMSHNAGYGMTMEISAKFVVAGNSILSNGGAGINLNDTDDVQLWHNTAAGNAIDLRVVQDSRRATDASIPGHNRHRPANDPTMPWVVSRVVVSDNVFSRSTGGEVVSVQDNSGEYTAAQLGVSLNGNEYQRATPTSPHVLVLWGKRGNDIATDYTTLKSFRKSTGQEKAGVELPFVTTANRNWLGSDEASAAAGAALPTVPAPILALLGWTSGNRPPGAPAIGR